jgi:predicted nucleic acid-binding protein
MWEPDSLAFRERAAQAGAPPVTAEVTALEMRRVAFRKELTGGLQSGTAETTIAQVDADAPAGRIQVVEQSRAVVRELDEIMAASYRRNPALPLRTLDALHLGSARVAGESEIVATDAPLREAAWFLGFSLFPA